MIDIAEIRSEASEGRQCPPRRGADDRAHASPRRVEGTPEPRHSGCRMGRRSHAQAYAPFGRRKPPCPSVGSSRGSRPVPIFGIALRSDIEGNAIPTFPSCCRLTPLLSSRVRENVAHIAEKTPRAGAQSGAPALSWSRGDRAIGGAQHKSPCMAAPRPPWRYLVRQRSTREQRGRLPGFTARRDLGG